MEAHFYQPLQGWCWYIHLFLRIGFFTSKVVCFDYLVWDFCFAVVALYYQLPDWVSFFLFTIIIWLGYHALNISLSDSGCEYAPRGSLNAGEYAGVSRKLAPGAPRPLVASKGERGFSHFRCPHYKRRPHVLMWPSFLSPINDSLIIIMIYISIYLSISPSFHTLLVGGISWFYSASSICSHPLNPQSVHAYNLASANAGS